MIVILPPPLPTRINILHELASDQVATVRSPVGRLGSTDHMNNVTQCPPNATSPSTTPCVSPLLLKGQGLLITKLYIHEETNHKLLYPYLYAILACMELHSLPSVEKTALADCAVL